MTFLSRCLGQITCCSYLSTHSACASLWRQQRSACWHCSIQQQPHQASAPAAVAAVAVAAAALYSRQLAAQNSPAVQPLAQNLQHKQLQHGGAGAGRGSASGPDTIAGLAKQALSIMGYLGTDAADA